MKTCLPANRPGSTSRRIIRFFGRGKGSSCSGLVVCCLLIGLWGTPGQILFSQETAAFFKANCASCHTIGGGPRTGPDLKDVVKRAEESGKSREWLIEFIQDPGRMINSGDPYAARILQEAGGKIIMPKIAGMTPEKAAFLIELIEAESALEESQFKGAAISMEPFTDYDVQAGYDIFVGRKKLKNGGPMCMSCHRLAGVGGLGGGNLGPDLTNVYERLKGRASLGAWLSAPATPTMQSLLAEKKLEPDEIKSLLALFEDRATKREPDPPGPAMVGFSIIGLIGVLLVLFLFDSFWSNRLRSIRRKMVDDAKI